MNDIQHSGVLGMKWGKHKYHNSDGTYNDAGQKQIVKDLIKDHKKSSSYSYPYLTSKEYKKSTEDLIKNSKNITKQDIDDLRNIKEKWFAASKKAESDMQSLEKTAQKLAKETYDKELKKNGDSYPTERAKEKLFEAILFDDETSGYSRATSLHPELVKKTNDADKLFDEYQNKRIDIGKKVLGKYGDTVLHKDRWSQYTVNESIAESISKVFDSDITYDR